MTNITLLRHGEPEGGRYYRGSTDDPLTPLGLKQMQLALPQQKWDQIICSPLQRCQQYAKWCNQPYKTDNNWQEIHFGDWEGQTYDALKKQFGDAVDQYWQTPDTYTPNNAEPIQTFFERTQHALNQAVLQPEHNILVITHGGNIRMVLKTLCHIPWNKLAYIATPYACISTLQYSDQRFQLVSHNPQVASC